MGALGPGRTARTTRWPGSSSRRRNPDGGGVQPGVAAEDVLGVRVGTVLADEREHGGQVRDTRGAREHAGP